MSETSAEVGAETTTLLVCQYGLERSRAGAEAFQSIGINIGHFVGGTMKISRMSEPELKKAIKPNTSLLLIYDQGSADNEYMYKEAATDKLRKAGINYTIIDTAQLEIMLYERGLNLSDFLY